MICHWQKEGEESSYSFFQELLYRTAGETQKTHSFEEYIFFFSGFHSELCR